MKAFVYNVDTLEIELVVLCDNESQIENWYKYQTSYNQELYGYRFSSLGLKGKELALTIDLNDM